MAKNELAYSIYSDPNADTAKAFGLAFTAPEAYNKMLEKASGQDHHVIPVPAVYLVSPEGKVVFVYTNPDYKVRLEPAILLAAAKALK